eukprot:gb/GECH01007509.1/.p1 GENE.gb/GECH01007509.1/~~gb/GECH01007509.1/.p1  ORF type:complete len:333 (+),score=46.82 gb/GECH01007509.1/:1-999(+)
MRKTQFFFSPCHYSHRPYHRISPNFSINRPVLNIRPTSTIASIMQPLLIDDVPCVDPKKEPVSMYTSLIDDAQSNVVYFQGDIQTFREEMKSSSSLLDFVNYSIEDTLEILKQRFPLSNIIMIRPRTMNNMFSVYDQFIEYSGPAGEVSRPNRPDMGVASQQLIQYLEHLKRVSSDRYSITIDIHRPLTLIGFSKGCLVINELVHESISNVFQDRILPFLRAVYYLDSGNNIRQYHYPTISNSIRHFARQITHHHIHVAVHWTPYHDGMPELSRERDGFISKLEAYERGDDNKQDGDRYLFTYGSDSYPVPDNRSAMMTHMDLLYHFKDESK